MLSTHNLAEVEASCPRVLIVSRGKLAADGAPDDLASRSGKARYVLEVERKTKKGELSSTEAVEAINAIGKGMTVKQAPSEDDHWNIHVLASSEKDMRRELFNLAVEKGWTLLELRKDVVQLEEVFRDLTVGDMKAGSRIAAAGISKAEARKVEDDEDDDEDEDEDEDDSDDDNSSEKKGK